MSVGFLPAAPASLLLTAWAVVVVPAPDCGGAAGGLCITNKQQHF